MLTITDFKIDRSLIGKLNSSVDVYALDLNVKPATSHIHKVKIPHIIPTHFIYKEKERISNLKKAVENYIENIKLHYSAKLKKSKNSKLRKTEKEKRIIALESFLDNINNEIYLKLARNSRNYQIYHLITPPLEKLEQNLFLSDFFMVNSTYNSYTELINLKLNYPYSQFSINPHSISKKKNLEILLNSDDLCFDEETHNWKDKKIEHLFSHKEVSKLESIYSILLNREEKPDLLALNSMKWLNKEELILKIQGLLNKQKKEFITTTSTCSSDYNYNNIITIFKSNDSNLKIINPNTNKTVKFKIININDHHEMFQLFSYVIKEQNPLKIFGQNHWKYDYTKANDLTNNLNISINNSPPVRQAGIANNFLERRVALGRIDLDTSIFAKKFLNLSNSKLDTIYKHITGVKFQKTITHDQLFDLTIKALEDDQKAIDKILYYAGQDVIKTRDIANFFLKPTLLMAHACSCSASKVIFTQDKSLTSSYWNKIYYLNNSTYIKKDIKREELETTKKLKKLKLKTTTFEDFNLHKTLLNLYQTGSTKKYKAKKGKHSALLFYPTPLIPSLESLALNKHSIYYLSDIYEELKTTNNKIHKRIYSKFLNSLLAYPFFKILKTDTTSQKSIDQFSLDFSLPKSLDLFHYKSQIWNNIQTISESISSEEVINYNPNFLVLKYSSELEERLNFLESNNLGVNHGRCNIFSFKAQKFILDWNGTWHQGIADTQTNKGERNEYEKSFFDALEEDILRKNDIFTYITFADQKIKDLYANYVPHSELEFSKELKRDYQDFSKKNKQTSIKKIKEKKLKKGTTLKYTYTIDKLTDRYFNEKTGKISLIFNALFSIIPKKYKKETNTLLNNLYRGELTTSERLRLIDIYKINN
jgi:hypothetical protein